jgi:Uma2 family endonuclease
LDVSDGRPVGYHVVSARLIDMETTPGRIVLTYRDYEALPADGRRYELYDGELVVTAAPGTPHQRLVGRLFRLLQQHVEEHGLGEVFVSPVDCILSDTTVVQPDLAYVESSLSSLVSLRGIEGPPTLVVEILSRSTAQIDRGAKLQLYARHGVSHYWIVDPDERLIEAHASTEGVFRVVARLSGIEHGSLPPFTRLLIAGGTLWP